MVHQSVLYTTHYLQPGLTVVNFCRNQLSAVYIGLLPLYPGQRNELHFTNLSVFHAAFDALQPAKA